MARIQKTVYDVVVATVADYPRMKKMLEKGSVTKDQAVVFARKVAAVDNALIAVCDGESGEVVEALRSDIANRKGFENAASRTVYTTKETFHRRKRKAVDLIAKMLNLI